jgi:hypothetical protein
VASIAAGMLSLPATAAAQRHGGPVIHSRPAVSVGVGIGVYYGPSVYRSWYASPYFYWGGYGYPFYPYYGFGAFYGAPWYPYAYGYPYPYAYDPSGSLRLQVTPKQAGVFVDGYYAGTVDDFDGTFQRLHVEPGEHDLQVYLPGHRLIRQKVYMQPGKTFSVKQAMEPLAAGEVEPEPPVPAEKPAEARPPQSRQRSGRPPARSRDQVEVDPGAPAPSPSRPEFGAISLRVQPGDAAITIDGERWENAPLNERLIVQLGTGVHTVEIRKDGYRTYITDITVRPGETATLNVSLTPSR